MEGVITLRKPVLIDGEEVRELAYDIDEIGSEQFMEADARAAAKAAGVDGPVVKVPELDTGFHFYLGVMAVLAANPGYMVEDVERVKGPDLMQVARVGRNFMTAGAEEDEDEDFPEPEDETGEPDEPECYPIGLE